MLCLNIRTLVVGLNKILIFLLNVSVFIAFLLVFRIIKVTLE